jgi:ABC-type amino acid transport substrate-binding protein
MRSFTRLGLRRVIGVTALLFATVCAQAGLLACGDKFFLVGNGGRFAQAYASLHPGSVLIYTGGSTDVSQGLRNARLHRYIKDAGHRLVLAADRAELQRALQAGQVDVIVGGLGQAGDLIPEAASAASKPTVLPIQGEGADASSPHQFATTLKASDKINKFLSGIEGVMKTRKAGARSSRS